MKGNIKKRIKRKVKLGKVKTLILDFYKDAFLKILTVTPIELKLGLLQKN